MEKKRSESISFRVSPDEKIMLKKAAQAFNKTVSGFIRDIILGISSDVVQICNNMLVVEPKNLKPSILNPPKKVFLPLTKENGVSFRRGSALDYKTCMDELKRVLKEKKIYWVCAECGYIHEGIEPPAVCPSCSHPQGYFYKQCEEY